MIKGKGKVNYPTSANEGQKWGTGHCGDLSTTAPARLPRRGEMGSAVGNRAALAAV